MRTSWRVGHVLLAVGLGWWIFDWVLTSALPGAWGGPNIGGGLLLLLTAAIGLVGLAVVVVIGAALPLARAGRRRAPTAPTSAARGAPWRRPLLLNGVLVVALLVVRAVLPGNAGVDGWTPGLNGVTGISADSSGQPVLVLVLAVCHGSVDTVTVYGPHRGDQPNELLLELHTDEPVTSSAQVDLAEPGAGWTGGTGQPLPETCSLGVSRFLW